MCELTENSAAGASDQESIAYLKLVLKNMVDEVIVPFDEEQQEKKAGEKPGDAKAGDKKAGDAKEGDAEVSDAKVGDLKK
jgi:hypothetical protein